MKRMLTLALVAAFIIGFVGSASAVELKVKGEFQVHGEWTDNVGSMNVPNFQSNKDSNGLHSDAFTVEQRLRTQFHFVANENLKAVWAIEVGTNFWGQSGGRVAAVTSAGGNPTAIGNVGRSSGFGPDGDGVNIETKWAYLDFNVPGSTVNVKAGLQPLIMPSAFNGSSAILDIDSPAVVVSTPLNEMVALTVGWTRPVDNYTGSTTQGSGATASTGWDPRGTRAFDEADIFFAAVPLTPKGFSITPFGMYALAGRDSGLFGTSSAVPGAPDSAKAWWTGAAFEMTMFEPFVVSADFDYGQASFGNLAKQAGWLADAMIQYKGLPFGTPTLFGMYSTGDNDNGTDRKSERMPFVQSIWGPSGSFFYSGTTFDSWSADIGGGAPSGNAAGTWTVGGGIYGMSFLDKLTHDLLVLYISGTNSRNSVALQNAAGANAVAGAFGYSLTTKDHLYEVDFNHQYQIYEQLSAIVEIGYIQPHFDRTIWGLTDTSDAWRVMAGFKYKF